MPLSPRSRWLQATTLMIGCAAIGTRPSRADDFPPPAAARGVTAQDQAKAVVPLPPVAIPTDPPPHEGALIDLTLAIEPPDILVVEVLMALPGRPITGERLVRPDGTISLGFYGDVHVRGLTTSQAKVKIIHHLRTYLNDPTLGLMHHRQAHSEFQPLPAPGTKVREGAAMPEEGLLDPREGSSDAPAPPASSTPARPVEPAPAKPEANSTPKADRATRRAKLDKKKKKKRVSQTAVIESADRPEPTRPEPSKPADKVMEAAVEQDDELEMVYLDPADSNRVFVDIAARNSKVYFVQGDVGTQGRLPFTGRETVLDALTYAGGLIPTAEATDIHLYRPARGDQPAHDYRIDHAAILKGNARANLQLFPNDRLVVGRNAIIKKTIEMDRATALTATIFTNFNHLNTALRSINPGQTTTESRLGLAEWFDILWRGVADDPAVLNEPARFREFVAGSLERTRRPR